MRWVKDQYKVRYKGEDIGIYDVFSDGKVSYISAWRLPEEYEEELKALGLDKDIEDKKQVKVLDKVISDKNRVPGRKRIIYEDGPFYLERRPNETDEKFFVYRRSAEKGDPDYSDLNHDAPHYEGPNTPKDMKEWASWYAFNKMDDGTYEAELDEAWWWGGGHNDGGTIHTEIPEEWFDLPYEEFLDNVLALAAARHYGFTVDILLSREGLKEFFGYADVEKGE